jgi:hypothetical protein
LDNIIYGVAYPGGGSGKFIQSMIIYMLLDDTSDMEFTDATSHFYYARYLKKHPKFKALSHQSSSYPTQYELLRELIGIPLPLVDTPTLDINLQEAHEHGLEYKLIYISVTKTDLPIISANHYYKQPAVRPYFSQLSDRLFSTPDLSKLSQEQENILINHPEVLGGYTHGYVSKLKILVNTYQEQFRNSLYCINFSDIINNTDKVKNLLETITNKTMSSHAHTQYDRYVESQIKFRKEKGF